MTSFSLDPKVTSYLIQAQEEDIKRIATELHEGVSQTLYSVFTGLQLIENQLSDPKIKQFTGEMVQLTERTIEELRWVCAELYPASLDALGILPALKAYLKVYTSTFGIDVDVKVIGKERPLTAEQRIALFRSCQEALNNSAKYSDTDKIMIECKWEEAGLVLTIADFGVGFSIEEVMKERECFGIASMKQRLALISGTTEVESDPGKGTKIVFSLPFN